MTEFDDALTMTAEADRIASRIAVDSIGVERFGSMVIIVSKYEDGQTSAYLPKEDAMEFGKMILKAASD